MMDQFVVFAEGSKSDSRAGIDQFLKRHGAWYVLADSKDIERPGRGKRGMQLRYVRTDVNGPLIVADDAQQTYEAYERSFTGLSDAAGKFTVRGENGDAFVPVSFLESESGHNEGTVIFERQKQSI